MIKSLTTLRFIFVLFIFLHHTLDYVGGGTMAVAFFFVLGGFSMTLGYKEKVLKPDFDYKSYLLRRCIKFYPLHWLCLFTVVFLTLSTFNASKLPILTLNFFLLHSWVPIKEVFFSYNSVSWYLADTMFFAFVFPFFLKWIVKASTMGRVVIAFVSLVLYAFVVIVTPKEYYQSILYISPYMRLFDFLFGIYLALVYFKLKENKHVYRLFRHGSLNLIIVCFLIAVLVVESVFLTSSIRMISPSYWLLIAVLLLVTVFSDNSGGLYRILENKVLVRLGNCSFIFFMIHTIVIRFSSLIYTPPHATYIYYLILSIVFSLFIEQFILTPITKWLSRRIQLSMTARS